MTGEMLSPEKVSWINARFLTRPVTGVERVAREVISALVRDHLDSQGCWRGSGQVLRFGLIAPRTPEALSNPWPELTIHHEPNVPTTQLTGKDLFDPFLTLCFHPIQSSGAVTTRACH